MGVCEEECMGHTLGDEPQTLMGCHSYLKPLKVGSPSVAKPKNLKGKREKFLFFLLFFKLCFSFTVAHFMA